MAPAEKLLSDYQQVFALNQQMLTLAREEKWDELIAREIHYVHAIENTLPHTMPPLTASQQDSLKETLRAILENEREIKRLLQLRMNVISRQLMNQTKRQKAVNAAYGQPS